MIAYLKSLTARFLRRAQTERQLEEELRLHIQMRIDDLERLGVNRAHALRQAQIEFGGYQRFKEETRDALGASFLDQLIQDVRFGFRTLRKSPGFTTTAILTIALAIGATTAIFTVVDATLLRPLPYPHPEQLVYIQDDLAGTGAQNAGLSQPEWQDLQHSGIFNYVSPVWFDENNLTGSSRPARVPLVSVASNYFALLGIAPQLGRTFDPNYNGSGYLPEAVISDALWKKDFGSDPNILEKSIRLDTDLYHIIGVMPPGFQAPAKSPEEQNIHVWVATSFYGPPLVEHPPRNRRNLPGAIARLRPGLTIAPAQSQLDALVTSMQQEYSGDYPKELGWRIRLVPLKEIVVGNCRQPLLMLLGAVALVLLIGCVNVANLMLARASNRGREMAVRQALGAAGMRLMQQLLTESILLSSVGGIAGLAILFGAKDLLLRLVPDSLPRLNALTLSWNVLLFALATSFVAGIVFGLAPALRARRLDILAALNQEGRASTGSRHQTRTRSLLVITEFALSLVLMVAAALLLRSFWDLLNVRLGFNPQSVMSVRTRLPYPNDIKIDKYSTAAQETPFLRELSRRCAGLAGVEQVAIGDSGSIPLDTSQRELNILEGQFFITLEGHDPGTPARVERSRVSPGYFQLLGLWLVRGRLFNDSDTDQTPQVAVVNEAMARTFWPNENPVGKHFQSTRANSPVVTIVGVVANARTQSLAEVASPQIYVSLYQVPGKHLAILLRGHFDTAAIPDQVREQVQSLDDTLPVFGARKLTETVTASVAQERFALEMVALFALTALLLAALGIYGVISYMVSERRHEIGIRIALGAQMQNILRMVLRQGVRLAVIGAVVGVVCALIVCRLMSNLLYGVAPYDPVVFVCVPLLLFAVAIAASYLPARRAAKVDPIIALRDS